MHFNMGLLAIAVINSRNTESNCLIFCFFAKILKASVKTT